MDLARSVQHHAGDPLADTEERAQLRSVVSELVADVVPPARARELDDHGEFDEDLYTQLAAVGVLSLGGAPEYGGSGDIRDQVVAIESLAAGATSMAVYVIVHYMVLQILSSHGSPEQCESVLGPLIEGRTKAAFALTEPDGGTDVARAMRTQAVRDGDRWLLNGQKMWISGAARADQLLVLARTDADAASVDGISMFLVPTATSGVMVRELDTVAIHGLDTCEITFDDVALPESSLVGTECDGFRQVLATLNHERLNAAAGSLGAGGAALQAALDYAMQREAFGKPIGAFQVLQHRLVDGAIALESARGLMIRAAEVAAAGGKADVLSSMAKVAASEAAVQITQDGMQLMGGAGFSLEFPMQRYFRDVRLWTFSPLTNEMVRNYLGERLLGLPRSF
jgi:alkylation response protein AidB-like acyl-CoA dehydrogenase